jgi:protein TonB
MYAPPFDNRMSETYQGSSPNARLLAGSVADPETTWASYVQRVTGSVVTHLLAFAAVLYVVTRTNVMAPVMQNAELPNITWIARPGPGGGGGGGGNRMPDPPKKAEIVPSKAPKIVETPKVIEPPKPLPQMNIPAITSVVELPGAVTAKPEATISQGPGVGGGGGTGTGTGVGPGTGSGLGPGSGGNTGGGFYREGNGVSSPQVIKEVKPNYTGEAMRARIQGLVTMEAIVMPDGSVGNVHIIKSLDNTFGLDQEAVATIKKWRFKPGMLRGQPVPVQIVIEMSFTLR